MAPVPPIYVGSQQNAAPTRPKARPAKYAEAVSKKLLAHGDGAVGGFDYGLDQSEAMALERVIRKTIFACAGRVTPERQPSNRYQRDRLRDAYVTRGLKPDLSLYPGSMYE